MKINNLHLTCRRGTTKDQDALVRLGKEIIDYHNSFDKKYKKSDGLGKFLKKAILENLNKKGFYYFVMESDKVPVGFLSIAITTLGPIYTNRKIAFIGNAFIEKKYRKLGLTRLALNVAFKVMRNKKVKEIRLSVDTKNVNGYKAWQKLGFSEYRKIMVQEL